MTSPIPQGFSSITPHIILDGGTEQLTFYQNAFNAEVIVCMPGPDNILMHAELKIGNAIVMVGSNQWGEMGPKSPKDLGGAGCYIHLYVENCDAAYEQAINAGAETVMPPADMFWGDRYGQVKDPSGHVWSVATHIEDLSEDEINQRGQKWMAEMGGN